MPMAPENQPEAARKPIEQLQTAQPLEQEAAARADEILNAKTKQNNELSILNAKWATNADLKTSPNFTHSKKLIMAEVLNLIADSLDSANQQKVELTNLREAKKQLKAAISLGVGQMLTQLRPREILANNIILWKANSLDAKAPALRKNQTSLLIGPNFLIKPAFQKVVEHEVKATNFHIARGEYRSFMFLPFDKLEGESMSLIPYMRMAENYHFHILGALPVEDNLDSMGKLVGNWKFNINSVGEEEQSALSHASMVANELVVRPPHEEYHEKKSLNVGLNYAFGAQMTKYFQREKKGHWFVPIIHPKIKPTEMKTVNVVDRRGAWQDAVSNQFNFAYTTNASQDATDAGVRIYGGSTTFPEDAVDIQAFGNQAVPLIQSQARVTRNRIYFFLITELERYVGGQEEPKVIRAKVEKYLQDMKEKKQIKSWKIAECSKDDLGKFKVKVNVGWSSTADEFEIDAESRDEEAAEE
ncbi:MAG: hypothetical protein V3V49_03015 [Candidatus Krumholzibacteria bacterium]